MQKLHVVLAATFLVCCSVAHGARARSGRAVPSDVKYIACEACSHVAAAVAMSIAENKEPVTELSVLDVVEAVCNPRQKAGRWTRSVDLVEQRRKLSVLLQNGVQDCNSECLTVALACEAIVDAVGATEIAEAAFRLARQSEKSSGTTRNGKVRASALAEWMCKPGGPAGVCDQDAPLLPRTRPKGPEFSAKPVKDVEIEDLVGGMNVPGMKMFRKEDLQDMAPGDFGQDGDEDDDDDGEGDAVHGREKQDEGGVSTDRRSAGTGFRRSYPSTKQKQTSKTGVPRLTSGLDAIRSATVRAGHRARQALLRLAGRLAGSSTMHEDL